jgi:demethylmenaquinone methyltransferase / 2-methoxy-6-polyprenyl-1,4-benzoquinol methylase
MFDQVVDRYDLLNGVLSLGLDRWWRRATIRSAAAGPKDRLLDLGCGTGDLALAVGGTSRVVGIDVSLPMLLRARQKRAPGNQEFVRFIQASAFHLPFADAAFDVAVSGFVLRNLDDLPAAFAELARVIRPGGRIALVDITGPNHPVARRAFAGYFGTVAPLVGRLTGHGDAYRYLVRSVAHLPPAEELCEWLRRAGFPDARATAMTGGVVTLFRATRDPARKVRGDA